MFQAASHTFNRTPQSGSGPVIPEPANGFNSRPATSRGPSSQGLTYAKIFRWRLPDGQTEPPQTVEVAGTFNHLQKVPLLRDGILAAGRVTLHHIPGNKTHHYMIFVDGKPVQDKHCDGLAIPHGPHEE